jgi:membrane protein implicated in regulation of membrane protease activity
LSFLSSLFVWANVPFTIALGVAVVFALLQATGVLGLLAGGGDHDSDADHDGSADAHHDMDHDGGHDGGHDADHDADHDGHHDADHGVGHQILVDLGVGRVPMSILWQTFAASFAFAGIATNAVYLSRAGALPTHSLAWTLPTALVFAYLVTRGVSRVIGRLVSDPKQEATSRKQLVGQAGVVISSRVSDEFGEVRLRDKTGHVLRIICRTRPGEKTIPEGREVVIVEHDKERDWLFVAPLDDTDDAPAPPAPRAAGEQAALSERALAAEEEALAAEERALRKDAAP